MEESDSILRIMSVGGAGTGKSALGNIFVSGKHNSNEFISGDAPDLGGVTRIVSSKTGNLFNDKNQFVVQYFDTPGLNDPTLDLDAAVQSLFVETNKQSINAAFVCIKSLDNRWDLAQLEGARFYKDFFKKLQPESIWICITHCDLKQQNEEWAQKKIKKFAECELIIPQSNVLFFNTTKESLFKLIEWRKNSLKNSLPQIVLVDNAEVAIKEFIHDIPKFVNKTGDLQMKQEYRSHRAAVIKEAENRGTGLFKLTAGATVGGLIGGAVGWGAAETAAVAAGPIGWGIGIGAFLISALVVAFKEQEESCTIF